MKLPCSEEVCWKGKGLEPEELEQEKLKEVKKTKWFAQYLSSTYLKAV